MIKLGSIDFDDGVLDAIRNNNLVIFAGAGVSMGAPSNLSSFWKLTCDVAQGTGLAPTKPLDRFLGQLQHRKVAVHERAAQFLSPPGSAPNALHQDILRIFRTADRVRLVTTNFDLHFETAARMVFGSTPDVYKAPALPLGYDFNGIVHVHGALPRAQEMVLTDADFGRAYLTEGWARRFLVDVFHRFTVLFVGYSHNDVVMNYLTRALPADNVAGRFALTDEVGNWDLLGIKPIRFTKLTGSDPFTELYDGVHRLADRVTRGALDWQTRLVEIGSHIPPIDEETISEVEQALRDISTMRFLLKVARDPEWLKWLNARKHLDALFGNTELSEREKLLASWVADHFVITHADTMFEILASHELQLQPLFWWYIGRELGVNKDKTLNESDLTRWVSILLASKPVRADHHVLMWLAERCASNGSIQLALKTFFAMSEHYLIIKPAFNWYDDSDHKRSRYLDADCPLCSDQWSLNEIWIKCIKPHLMSISQPLLSGITHRLGYIHGELMAWGKASSEWDPVSYRRSAIEPHEQDQYPEAVDVLIDAARDALEFLALKSPSSFETWVETLATSEVPLLRRLAIHAITVHPSLSADDRLKWLLTRIGLHEFSEHHEVHRAVALSYIDAGDTVRQAVIDAILTHQCPAIKDWTAEEITTRSHFDWLSWLLRAKPDCAAAKAALMPIKETNPDWRLSEHPDFTHWSGPAHWVGSQSPWSVEQLLVRAPRDQLDDLLNYNGVRFDGPNREGLIENIRYACKQNPKWAFDLLEVLDKELLWKSDVWPAVLRGLQEAELSLDNWHALLSICNNAELISTHTHDIANLLYALVKDGGKPFALDLLEQANAIGTAIWQIILPSPEDDNIDDWLSRAINRSAGVIVEFWINGLSVLMHGKHGAERTMPDDYRQWFTTVVQDPTSKGGLGRSLLASQTAFLFGLDETWTSNNIIPLFSEDDQHNFAQAWDGFLVWGRLYPALVDAMMPAFFIALQRLNGNLPDHRRRFIEFYTSVAVFHVSDPLQQILPALFQYGSIEDRLNFTSQLGYFLRQMQQTDKQQMWNTWLNRYWMDRLQGVLAPLDDAEIRNMLDWLPHLGELFPEASILASRANKIAIEHSHLLFQLRDSDLVTCFPAEMAELLIYLCNCNVGYHADNIRTVAARLPELDPYLKHRLDEALALIG